MEVVLWGELAVLAVVIWTAGHRLSITADIIAEKTGLGRTWIGLMLLGTVTSLPELGTGIGASRFAQAPDLAVGDVLGSCLLNLALIVVLDIGSRRESLYTRASHGHVLSAALSIVLLGLVALHIEGGPTGVNRQIGHIGISSVLILLLYPIAVRAVFRFERQVVREGTSEAAALYPEATLPRALGHFAAGATVIIAAGLALPFVAEDLAHEMGWRQSFVGTLLVAFSTSLPELSVTIAAFRLGAVDLSISNLLGSNLFDVLIIAIDDLLYTEGPILDAAGPEHIVSALSAIMMTAVVIVGLISRPASRVLRTVQWTSIALFAIYAWNVAILYTYG